MRKGYIPVGGCDNAVRPTALHEKFSCSRVDGVDASLPYYNPTSPNSEAALYFGEANRWPQSPAGFQAAWEEYYRAMEALAARLMRIFAAALGLPQDFFDDKIDKHVTNLVALRYPPPSVPSTVAAAVAAAAAAATGGGGGSGDSSGEVGGGVGGRGLHSFRL